MNKQGRVLIVDDDADIRSNFADILSEVGYSTTTVENGEAALECVRQQEFDVVLLDYKMPGMDGATLYNEIKKLRPSIAAIMVTAWAGSDGVQRAMNAGTWDVLRKPVNIGELLDKLNRAVHAPIILVVDDDEEFCHSLWEILNLRRFRVSLAHSESEGIRQADLSQCQIAIVDLKLGTGDGTNVLRRIHNLLPSTVKILISGKERDSHTASELLGRMPIDAFYSKPLDVDGLLEMIDYGRTGN